MSENVNQTNNHKQMPHALHLAIFLFVLGAICAILLAVVDYFTAPVIKANSEKELAESLEASGVLNYTDITNTENITIVDGVNAIYKGVNKNEEEVIAVKVVLKNKYVKEFTTIVVINSLTKKLENIKVVGKATTHNMDSSFQGDFGLIGSDNTTIDGSFQIVAGATFSSKTVKESALIAYSQFEALKGGATNE